jgi:ribosomal protein S18 acetylase RimI-like enzyme
MTSSDVPAAVRLHEQSFADNFMTTFGSGFLTAFYEGLIAHPDGYGCVAVDPNGATVGFCVGGSAEVQGIARKMLKRRPLAFIWPAFINVLRSPSRLPRVLRVARGNLGSGAGDDAPPSTALLMQIAVTPEYRGSGAADRLVEDFLAEMRRRGATTVSLGVESDNLRAIAFYRRLGFRETKPGIFEYDLASAPVKERARP